MQAIESRGLSGKVKLITFDTSDSHVAALKAGTIDLMLVQDSRRMGYEVVKSLATKLQGGTPPVRLDLPVQVIAKSDLGRPEIQALLVPKMGR